MDIRVPQDELYPDDQAPPVSAPLAPLDAAEATLLDPLGGFEWVAPGSRAGLAAERCQPAAAVLASELAGAARPAGALDAGAFFQRHGGDSAEGIALMMLAESLARAPDDRSRQALLFDILPRAEWRARDGSGAIEALARLGARLGAWEPGRLGRAVKALGEAGAARAARAAIGAFAGAFVAGRTADDAAALAARGGLRSFDMLGESATTEAEASRYFQRYLDAIHALPATPGAPWEGQGVSVKLSALDPLFDRRHAERSLAGDRLLALARACQAKNLLLTVDAEEAERWALCARACERVLAETDPLWEGFGWAIQANLRSCGHAVEHALGLARAGSRRLALRLVKGAYWDSETRKAIAGGYPNPCWPAKGYTDRSWLAGALALLREPRAYPMLASHNPHSLAMAWEMAQGIGGHFEFQRLHGMGQGAHEALVARGCRSRVYAPIGETAELLPYLARRMLENGANTSILRLDARSGSLADWSNPFASHPGALAPSWEAAFEPVRENSPGAPLWLAPAERAHEALARRICGHLLAPSEVAGDRPAREARSPADPSLLVGRIRPCSAGEAERMLESAHELHLEGPRTPAERSRLLESSARVLDSRREKILGAIVAETGKRMEDAISEWREARDFCSFHARQALAVGAPTALPSLPGERNWLWRAPRGVALCISPWNFPFAILMGQATGALAAGCPVVAKGASASTLCSQLVVDCLREAGFGPREAQHLIIPGAELHGLISDPRVAAVAFTGSTVAARRIAIALASREGPGARLVAETGGFNLMLVDETAHLDLACADILESAFNMSGQRCSSLRAAWVDARVKDALLIKLSGALGARSLGDPTSSLHVDFGPLIDQSAAAEAHSCLARLLSVPGNRLAGRARVPAGFESGAYFAPAIVETRLDSMTREEMFFPILQVAGFEVGQEEDLRRAWAQGGYGLTFGVQTRKPAAAEKWARLAPAGNVYVNRPMIGATVASQPFGGEGLSGTGPKIGGASYVEAFCVERALSNNEAAFGGCVDLLGSSGASLHRFFPEAPGA